MQEFRDGPAAARRFFEHLRDHHFTAAFMEGLDRALYECGAQRRERQERGDEEESDGGEM